MGAVQAKNVDTKLTIDGFNLEVVQQNLNLVVMDVIGVDAGLVISLGASNSSDIIEVDSNDLSLELLPRMFKKIEVISWGSIINEKDELFVRLHFRYHNFDGGSNGCPLARICFNTNGEVTKVDSNIV